MPSSEEQPTVAQRETRGAGARPLAVVHAVLSLDVGGLERVVLDLVREGKARGQVVSVLCLERPGTQAAEAEALGARVLCAGKRPGLDFSSVRRIREILGQARPDVVHTHQAAALLYAGAAARRAGVPVVVHTEHNNHIRKRQARFGRLRTRLLGRVAGRYARRIFCVSGDVLGAVREHGVYPAAKSSVVYNGIDLSPHDAPVDAAALRASLGIPADAPLVGSVGRLNEVKRQDLLVRAFAALRRTRPAAHLLLVGDGPTMGALRELAKQLSVGDCVHFAGYQARPAPYLRVMDVFALTSRIEGMPLVVLEAWAAGVPVVASRVGGIPEVVADGESGLLFESGDEGALVGLLSQLLADASLARRIAERGRELVRSRYASAVMAGNYERHYLELLGPAPLAAPDRGAAPEAQAAVAAR